ncbi:MAG: DoxX family protein [Chitinophagaceae bacterium]|nr:DoxX family protein [Chitinophagaceae bacterium]
MQRSFPFISLPVALTALRISLAIVFLAHAIVRIANNTIPQFVLFMESKHIPLPLVTVWAITVFEIAASICLILKRYVKIACMGLILILAVGIILIHASLGWFVGEHGTGGCEYSFILIVALLVIAAE